MLYSLHSLDMISLNTSGPLSLINTEGLPHLQMILSWKALAIVSAFLSAIITNSTYLEKLSTKTNKYWLPKIDVGSVRTSKKTFSNGAFGTSYVPHGCFVTFPLNRGHTLHDRTCCAILVAILGKKYLDLIKCRVFVYS